MSLQEMFLKMKELKVHLWWHLGDREQQMVGRSGGMSLQEMFENERAKVRFWWHLRDRE